MSDLKLQLPEKNRISRSKKVAKEIHRVVSEIFRSKSIPVINDDLGNVISLPKNLIITITDADISKDLQSCKIYYRVMNFNENFSPKNEENKIKNEEVVNLNKSNKSNLNEKLDELFKKYLLLSQPLIRKMIASQLRLRIAPMISFSEDKTPDLLNQIEKFWKNYDEKNLKKF